MQEKKKNSGFESSRMSTLCSCSGLAKDTESLDRTKKPFCCDHPATLSQPSPFLGCPGIWNSWDSGLLEKTVRKPLRSCIASLNFWGGGRILQNPCPIGHSGGGGDFCFRLTGGFIMPEGQYLPWLRLDEYLLLRSGAHSADSSRTEDLLFVCRRGC